MSDSSIAILCSSVVSVISVLVPLLITCINNHHIKKMKKIELEYENKINAYKDFFSEFGKYMANNNIGTLQSLGEKTSKAIMFSPKPIQKQFLLILTYCKHGGSGNNVINSENLNKAYINLVTLIAKDLKINKPSKRNRLINLKKSFK